VSHFAQIFAQFVKKAGLQRVMGARWLDKLFGELICEKKLPFLFWQASRLQVVILLAKVPAWVRFWALALRALPVATWLTVRLLVARLARSATRPTPAKTRAFQRLKSIEAACNRGRPLFVCQGEIA
jgi:hypothetical protein